MLVNGSSLEDDPAGGGFDQIAHRHDDGVDLESLFFQDLLDILADPGRFDHVGKVLARNQEVLEAGVGLRIPTRPIPISGQSGIQAKFGQIADQKACSRTPRSGDDEMPLWVGSGIGLRLGVWAPLSANAITNGCHAYAPGGIGFNRSPTAPL